MMRYRRPSSTNRLASLAGAALTIAGGYLAYKGMMKQAERPTSQNESRPRPQERPGQPGVEIRRSITVGRDVSEVYSFWRNLENLPRFMSHLESVTSTGDRRSHWVAKGPMGTTIEWEAETTEDFENERIAWRSLPDADIQNSGRVQFKKAPGDRGTEIHLAISYDPPGGMLGEAIADFFEHIPAETLEDELRHFKQILEVGEISTVDGQPSGRE
jgi:uncharacterized membrane protein